MKIIDKIAWLQIKNGKILSTRSKGKDTFYIPGGKRELGETDIDTLVREIKEELDVEIIKDSANYYGTFIAQSHGDISGVMVNMTCYMASYIGLLRASSEIAEYQWLSSDNIEIISPVDKLIFLDLINHEMIN
tara:strand:+ start:122 stop:520 length:399 start_codon:yes stop_codon:yes gene_type:complete